MHGGRVRREGKGCGSDFSAPVEKGRGLKEMGIEDILEYGQSCGKRGIT